LLINVVKVSVYIVSFLNEPSVLVKLQLINEPRFDW